MTIHMEAETNIQPDGSGKLHRPAKVGLRCRDSTRCEP